MIKRLIVIVFVLCGCSWGMSAQDILVREVKDKAQVPDSVKVEEAIRVEEKADSTVKAVLAKADSLPRPDVKLKTFKPDPNKVLLYSLVPGLGQIYNRKYWKLPIVYGGFMGFMYAITWNNRNYKDYSEAYSDIIYDYGLVLQAEKDGKTYDGPWGSWINYINPGSEATEVKSTTLQDNLKRRKDFYRRYRDLSIILAVGFYALTIIDAYVDAQLFDFDISPDLSLHWSPDITPRTRYNQASYGLNCSLKF